jgi:hypothetical protein
LTDLRLVENTDEQPRKKKLNPTMEFIFVAFAPIWSERYKNQKYFVSGQDAKLVYSFLKDNPDILDDITEIQTRAMIYLKDEWWVEQRHPAWGLCRHFNKYIPETKKIVLKKNFCRKCFREIPRTFGSICPECEREQLRNTSSIKE